MATIMVVDDEDVLVEMIAALIEDLGHNPLTANDGQQAYSMLRTTSPPPVLILSDVMMPRMNGLELASAIKKDSAFRHIPIILMSAAGLPADHHADRFIHKPFDIDTLATIISTYAS